MADTKNNILNNGIPTLSYGVSDASNQPRISMQINASQVAYSPTDKTLSVPEMPADAKATGQAIQNVQDNADEAIRDLAADLASNVSTLNGSIGDLEADLASNVSTLNGSIGAVPDNLFPVGSIYMTTQASVPSALPGTWTEILLPLTWGDAKTGTRSHVTLSGNPTRTVHFFLRTE